MTGPSRRGTISLLKESLAGLRAWDIGWAAYMFENRLIAKMFENRGWSEDYIREIDRDSHGPMMNVEQLIDAMDAARNSGFEFTLLSDFDMDGIMSGTLGFAGLSELGFKVNLFMPEPDEGYGFKERTIGRLVAQYPNTDVIITSDTGISCHGGVDAANSYHLDIYITDHHEAPEKPVNAKIIVDPMQPGDNYEHPKICGAYVLYQVIKAYADKYAGRETQEQIRRLRVFAGIGTVSDSMPLLYENRQLVRDAVSICRMVYANGDPYLVENIYGCPQYQAAFRGLFAVLKMFAGAGKIQDADDIDADFLGFYMAPVFNSVKRVGRPGDMRRAYGVFFGPNPDTDASYLYNLNNERKQIVASYFDALLEGQERDQPYAPYVYISDARPGVLGLLATRVMERTQKPCCVICDDNGRLRGSGRSPEWYPFKARTDAAFPHGTRTLPDGSLRKTGFHLAGHQVAFGVGFDSWAGVQELVDFLAADEPAVRASVDRTAFKYVPDFTIAHDGTGDTVIDVMLFMEFMDELKKLQPFGAGFRKPDILLKFRASDGEWIPMGKQRQHLKIKLPRGFEAVLFNQGEFLKLRDTQDYWYVRGDLGVNEYKGVQTVQFMGEFVAPELVE